MTETAILDTLVQDAVLASERAYCPYSNFPVGAAADTDIGRFMGCNIENASYGLAVCAERAALFAAISAGARHIYRLAVACPGARPDSGVAARMPCGACRQVIAEFMAPSASITVVGAGEWRVSDLLPEAFQLERRPFLENQNPRGRTLDAGRTGEERGGAL